MILQKRLITVASLIIVILSVNTDIRAGIVEYELTIAQQQVNFTGKPAWGMTINGGIPGPTLQFKEGDLARIYVHNKMNEETSIHWHGILVPPEMDGVPYISFPPIAGGTTFTYEFPIRQSGTYWYHSHTSMQEQSGVYGAIVIEPRHTHHHTNRDYVILVSDWTDENPHSVLRTLKRGSEWYSLQKGSGQSVFGAAKLGMLSDYFKRELQRMPPMDIADVAYDRFLANGKPESSLFALPGETVRLRIIDGSATTYFYLEFAGGAMEIISADGQDVEPVEEKRFLIGVAETYDVLVHMPDTGSYEFRATAHDGSGYTSVWIGSGKQHPAPDVPKPNLYHSMGHISLTNIFASTPAGAMDMSDSKVNAGMFDKPGMMDMGPMNDMKNMDHDLETSKMEMKGMNHQPASDHKPHHKDMQMTHPVARKIGMDHESHDMKMPTPDVRFGKKFGDDFGFLATDASSSKNVAIDGMDPRRPWAPYAKLRSVKSTAFDKDKSVRNIRLTLDGDMERYVWFLNNKPLSESDYIQIHEGEIARFIMINRTMMHHPMHLHGHFFRVINGQEDHAPLKHTVDVAPMSTTVIEFDANEVGDWFFHCHLLYHMESGMARMVHYEGFTPAPEVSSLRPKLYKDFWYFWGQADILSNMTEGFLMFSNTRNILSADWKVGWQDVDETEWEGIFTWSRYFNNFLSIFAGADLMGEEDELDKTRGLIGLNYLLPLNIESRAWIDSDAGARINFDKEFELTPRLKLLGEAEYDTHILWESSVGLSYTVHRNASLMVRWHSEYNWGIGAQIRF